jgi:hypothetical protein
MKMIILIAYGIKHPAVKNLDVQKIYLVIERINSALSAARKSR